MSDQPHTSPAPPQATISRWQAAVDLLAELGNVVAGVTRLDGRTLEVLVASNNAAGAISAGARLDNDSGAYCGAVVAAGDTLHVRDARDDPRYARAMAIAGGMRAYYGTPLRWPDGTLFGVLFALDALPNDFGGLLRRQFELVVRIIEAGLGALAEQQRLRAEIDAHRETQRLFNEAEQMARLGHWHHDLRSDELTWSDEMFRIYELDPAKFPASYTAFLGLVHPEDRSLLEDAFARAVAEQREFSLTYRLRMPDGRIKWMSARAVTHYDASGQPLHSTGTTQDITAGMETSLALRASEALHRQAEEIANIGHWRLDLASGRLDWSGQLFRIFEIDPQRFGADYESFLQLVPIGEREMLDKVYSDSVANHTSYEFEHRLLFPDGRIKWVVERAHTEYAADGTSLFSIGTTLDVTQRKLAERERDLLSRIVAELGEMVFIADLHGNLVYINEAVRRLLGLEDTPLPITAFDVVVPEEHALLADHIFPTLAAGGRWQGTHHYRVRNSTRVIEAHAFTFGIATDPYGPVTHLANVSLDLTLQRQEQREREALERQLLHAQRLESLGVMAGGIAHDFNNILQVVLGSLELIEPADTRSAETLVRARQAAVRAADIVRQLLTFAGRDVRPRERIDLGLLMEESAGLLRAVLDKRIRLVVEPPAVPLAVDAVAGQLQQVLMNLLTNAAEAIEDGKGSIIVRSVALAAHDPIVQRACQAAGIEPTAMACLEVVDTGKGMDEETRNRLFDPFFTTKTHGRGLGMPSVLGIVRAHRGAIELASAPGLGTTFRVLLPMAEAPATLLASAPAERRAQAAGMTLLLVDDDESIRVVGADLLGRRGFRVTAAAGGEEAIALLGSADAAWDAVILDLTMPGVDGAEVYRFLRERHPALPVLLASGFDYAEALRRIPASVHTAFISKPWHGEDLYAALAGLLAPGR